MKEQGHVLSVSVERLGDDLDAAALSAATTLVVGDVADFDELGGSLYINGTVLRYSTVDDDAGTITLLDPLPAAADIGDAVSVWDTRLEAIVTEHVAMVEVDGDDEGDAIEAVIAHHLIDDLPAGMRGLDGESVLIEEEDDAWRLIDVLGVGKRGLKFWNLDQFTLTADGAQDLVLTHTPVDGSEHIYWNGLQQTRTASWVRVDKTISILGAEALIDDVIDVEYAYIEQGVNPTVADRLLVPIGADWLYATGLGSSTTYAAAAFDDTAWATGTTRMGYGGFEEGTTLTTLSDVWQRLHVTTHGGDLTFTSQGIDDTCKVYIDGVEVFDQPAFTGAPVSFTEPATAGEHVVAVYGVDTGLGGMTIGFAIEEGTP